MWGLPRADIIWVRISICKSFIVSHLNSLKRSLSYLLNINKLTITKATKYLSHLCPIQNLLLYLHLQEQSLNAIDTKIHFSIRKLSKAIAMILSVTIITTTTTTTHHQQTTTSFNVRLSNAHPLVSSLRQTQTQMTMIRPTQTSSTSTTATPTFTVVVTTSTATTSSTTSICLYQTLQLQPTHPTLNILSLIINYPTTTTTTSILIIILITVATTITT